MLPNLSPSRLEILRIFYNDPSSEFYALQIKKILKISYDRSHTYLSEWEKSGILKSRFDGKRKLYKINKKHALTKVIFKLFEAGDRLE